MDGKAAWVLAVSLRKLAKSASLGQPKPAVAPVNQKQKPLWVAMERAGTPRDARAAESGRPMTIHSLRTNGHKDTAILDLLHLQELHELPVRLRVGYLRELWQCSQSQVSRRMAAIAELGCCCVENCWGRYRLSVEVKQTKRQRWAVLQQQWREAQS